MKKLLSVVMVIGIILSSFIAPVKAEKPTTGSITISNATIGEDYAVYKLFDANINFNSSNQADGINYTLVKTSENKALYEALFGTDGTKSNPYFQYNPSTKEVRAIGADTEIYAYLTKLITDDVDGIKGSFAPTATPKKATTDTVVFSGLPFGYYLITSSLGTAVTINSTAPDVVVIDKNQEPGSEFSKLVQDGMVQKKDELGNPVFDGNGDPVMVPNWVEQNSANIGDKLNYKISFEATNYDGMNKIQYYQIHDEKGDAIWVEFDSFEVFVNGVKLDRGYYLCQGDRDALQAQVWDEDGTKGFLGDWSGVANPTKDDAQWYLVHLGFDRFRITIPWLEGQKIETSYSQNAQGKPIVQNNVITYGDLENAAFRYDSPAIVEVYYEAGVEYNAIIGNANTSNLFNKSYASWTFTGDTGSTETEITETKVYGVGLTKKDGSNQTINLAGAEFEIYRDEACSDPVYVIPTGVDGVYIVDSLHTYLDDISGDNKGLSRDVYKDYLEAYLGTNWATTQKNLVTSQVNGKLIVLGLAEGTYYFKEVKAPIGYNSLSKPYPVIIDGSSKESSKSFIIYADENGKVADITHEDAIHHEIEYMLKHETILNGKGTTLPTTGAKGTMALITTGSVISILFAVLLITNKKMSIYKD